MVAGSFIFESQSHRSTYPCHTSQTVLKIVCSSSSYCTSFHLRLKISTTQPARCLITASLNVYSHSCLICLRSVHLLHSIVPKLFLDDNFPFTRSCFPELQHLSFSF